MQNSELPGLDFFLEVDENYGVDPDGPIANDDNQIDVPQTSLHFSERRMEIISQLILVVSLIILGLIYTNKHLELY